MTTERETVVDSALKSDNLRLELVSSSEPDAQPESPLRIAHRGLRGRYRRAVSLAVLLAAIFSIAGYFATGPKYTSRGLVQIEPTLPTILYPTAESRMPPMFDAYVASQTAYLQSSSLLAEAVQSPEMQSAGWPSGPKGVSALSEALTVYKARRENTISVAVVHREARLAQAAVNAILAAYTESNLDPNGLSLAKKEIVLLQREQNLEAQLEALRLQMLEDSDQYGAEAVSRNHTDKIDELMKADRKLEAIRLARHNVESGKVDGNVDGPMAGVGQVALDIDPHLAPLKGQELALVAEIRSLKYAAGHPVMRKLRRQLDAIRIQLQLRQRVQKQETSVDDTSGDDASSPILVQLIELEAGYVQLRGKLREQAATLGRQHIALSGLGEKLDGIRVRLKMTRTRLDEIRLEGGRENNDRVTIVPGWLPGFPSTDRRSGLAGAGAMFGVVAGFAIIGLVGLLDRRIRYLYQLEAMNLPVTLVPADPDRLRQSMELRSAPGSIYAVVSCDQGESGARLAHALAVSYSEAGYKTLLIDADFVNARISGDFDLAEKRGLWEAIGEGRGVLYATGNENLWTMPVGSQLAVTPKDFNRESMKRLYDEIRPQFDTVIVDAGVIRSEMNACIVTAESDTVLLNVDLNQRGEHIRSTVAQLGLLDIDDANLVFGPVTPGDDRPYHPAETQEHASPVVGAIRPDERKRAA